MPKKLVIGAKNDDEALGVDHKRAARVAMKEFDAALADVSDNWAGLDAGRKIEALRKLLIVVARSELRLSIL